MYNICGNSGSGWTLALTAAVRWAQVGIQQIFSQVHVGLGLIFWAFILFWALI